MFSLSGLNSPQRKAAETIEGPVLILAGAGSGKTRTITYRIAHMVENLKIPAKNILAVSFTNKAAKEMRERVIGLIGKRKAKGMTLATFHSLGVKILRQDIDKIGYGRNFSIYDTSDQIAIIREALKNYHDEKGNFDKGRIQAKISYLKNRGFNQNSFSDSPYFDPESSYDHAINYCFGYYQDKLKFYNAIDFDDILHLTVELLEKNPELRDKYSNLFQYIMVDEYQDTNPLQFQLILHLTQNHKNLCVVGDDDQAIYAFRGADVSNILSFEKNYPQAVVIKLEENYRSISPILDLANFVIKKNLKRRDKTLWSKRNSDRKPMLWAMGSTEHESQVVIEDIVAHQADGGHLGDVAILYRTNLQSTPLEEQLRLSNVPYKILGGQKFYDKKEVKDLISYLCLIHNTDDEMALRRILNIPARGIGNKTLEYFLEKSASAQCSLFNAMTTLSPEEQQKYSSVHEFVKLINEYQEQFQIRALPEAISLLIDRIEYLSFIDKSYSDNAKQAARRKNDVAHFIESANRFSKFHHAPDLKNFVERVLLQDSQDESDLEEDQDIRKNEVTLMTYHSSKGLEFDKVYMIGVEEGLLPSKKTISENSDIDEELRLCYVGITRAKEHLVMTYCKERKLYGKDTPRHRSRFLLELGRDDLFCEQDRTTFGHLSVEEAENYKKSFFDKLIGSLDD